MDNDKILSDVIKLEKKQNVNKFYFDQINYWPIVRTSFIHYRKDLDKLFDLNNKSFLNIISSLKFLIIFFFKKTPDIFLAYKNDRSAAFGNNLNYIHKQYESLVFSKKIKNKIILLEIGHPLERKTFKNSIDISLIISILYIFFRYFLFSKIYNLKQKLKIALNSDLNFSDELKNKILKNSIDFFIKKEVFKFLFFIKNPKNIYLKSFNNNNAFAACYAGNILNINTVEYQHGQQGSNSLTYSNWKNIPKKGYIILPKFFWVWNKIFTPKIHDWIKHQDFHELQVFKNYWPEIVKNKIKISSKFFAPNNIIKILYCMQTPKIDAIVIKVMKKLHNVKWHIRLHPRTKKSNLYKIENQLLKLKINYDLRHSNNETFELVLINSDILITSWSTTAYESFEFKKHTIIFGQNGYNAYNEFIQKGKICFARNHLELCNLIENINK